jgi:putative alpha-1,2-mannosidase
MPLTTISSPVNILDNTTYWQKRVDKDKARVGYYRTNLESGVQIELSATRHAGIIQYSFPSNGSKNILVDVSHYLPNFNDYNSQDFLGGEIELQDGGKQYIGYGTYGGGFGECAPMRIYFCGEFDQAPQEAQTWRARNTDPYLRQHVFSNEPSGMAQFTGNATQQSGFLNDRVGAVFTWTSTNTTGLASKIGISFISTQKACAFKDDEIPSWSLNETVQAAVDEWNTDVFNKIQVPVDESQNQTNLALLYSSLYFMHLMPSDRSGENPLWESDEPSFDDFYTAWDIFRCTVSLYHLIQPSYYQGMIRSLIDIWRHESFMPDGRSGNYNGLTQGGTFGFLAQAEHY